jgi:hypothetical protein
VKPVLYRILGGMLIALASYSPRTHAQPATQPAQHRDPTPMQPTTPTTRLNPLHW